MYLKVLRSLGFSEKEANLYVVLLKLGPQPVGILARKAGLARTTTYETIDDLIKRGFVLRFNQGKVQYFSPSSPDFLLEFVERKKRFVMNQEDKIRSFIPELKKIMKNSFFSPPKLSFFDGLDGIKSILSDVLNAKDSPLCFLNLDDWISGQLFNLKSYLDDLFRSKSLCFISDSLFSRDYVKNTGIKFRFLTEFGCQFFIYDNKIAIIWSHFGFVLENKEIAQLQGVIFRMLWDKSDVQ